MIEAFRLHPFEEEGHLTVEGGRLHMAGADLVALAEEHGTPLFVYSEARLRRNARAIRQAFEKHHPRSSVCFASKACANHSILSLLREEGLDLEVNSGGELWKAKQAGFEAGRLVFNGVAKSVAELEMALSPPIKAINVDSPFELRRIAEIAGRLGVRARVALRAVPGVEGGSTAGIETGSTRSKFGMTEAEIADCLDLAARESEAVAVVGLHVHIGSQMTDLGLYRTAGEFVARRAAEIRSRFPEDFGQVNIGGGFPINYVKYNDQSPEIGYFNSALSVDDVAEAVLPALTRELGREIEVLTEPGRSMTGNAGLCLARVEGIKQRAERTWLYLDAGYSVLPESAFGWYFHMVRANGADEEETAHFRVVGPLCDSLDVFFDSEGEARLASLLSREPALAAHEELLRRSLVRVPPYRELPASTGPGDLIALLDSGAYQVELANHYCGRLVPAAVMIRETGAAEVIRAREGLEALCAEE